MGVCTDVIMRSVRNAGLDLQKELHEDIKKREGRLSDDRRASATRTSISGASVRSCPTSSATGSSTPPSSTIRTIRCAPATSSSWIRSRAAPGPTTSASSRIALDDHGLPLVINNWTNGTVTSEMDLLTFVPVLYRFRLPSIVMSCG